MKTIAKYGTMIVIATLAARWYRWNDGWYLITGLITAGIPLAMLTSWRLFRTGRRTQGPQVDEPAETSGFEEHDNDAAAGSIEPVAARESIVVGGLHGVLLGFALSAYLAAAFGLLQQVPWFYARYYDADRVTLEAKVSTLEQAGNYQEAVAAIEDRMKRKTGGVWHHSLTERLYANLVQVARTLQPEQSLPLLNKARELASEHKFDDTAARTLEEQALGESRLANRIADLVGQEHWSGVVDVLKSELLRDTKSVVIAGQLYDAYCSAAVHADSLDKQAEFYTQAVELAGRFGLHSDRAQAALTQIKEVQSAREDNTQQMKLMADLDREGIETRRLLIEEMLKGAALENLGPELRLAELQRIAMLAEHHNVKVSSLDEQIRELSDIVVAQHGFIERISQLRSDGKYEEAISELASAVRSTDRRHRVCRLDTELLGCLVEWCDEAGDEATEQQSERLRKAAGIATECGLDAPVLKQRLEVVDVRVADRERVRQRIAALKRNHEFAKLASYLKVLIEEEPASDWAVPYGHELCQSLLASALKSEDLDQRCDLLREAMAVASKYDVRDSADVHTHLADTERRMQERADEEHRRTTPVELPLGSNAGIARISSEEQPFVIADVWVDGPDGAPISGLESKDFKVSVEGRDAPFFVQPVAVDPVRGYFVILVDTSGSVSPVMPVVKSAISELAIQLAQDKANMKLISFGGEVNTEVPWTTDPAMIAKSVQELEPKGGTALYRALLAASDELGRQPTGAKRTAVLFTDGKNEDAVGDLALDDVMLQLRENEIMVYAIGARTKDLDPAVLTKLAQSTDGHYAEADDAVELGTRFAELPQSIRRDRYRLVFGVADGYVNPNHHGVISVEIGSAISIVAKSNSVE